jgi:hypothetical protein
VGKDKDVLKVQAWNLGRGPKKLGLGKMNFATGNMVTFSGWWFGT